MLITSASKNRSSRGAEMGRFVLLILGAWSALQVLGVIAQDVPACIPGCANQLRSEFSKFCKNARDAACLCRENNFVFGVRDCGAHCEANDANFRQYLLASFCAGQFPSSAASSSAASSTPQPSTPTLATPVSTLVPASSTSTASASTQASTLATPASSTAAAATSATSASKTSAAASQTSTAPTGAETSEAAAAEPPKSSLSQASVVGIGVGVCAAVIALAGIVICLLLRSRKRTTRRSMEISKPLPGSGRTYPGRDHNSYEKYGKDIELTTNSYEDMVPRKQPRALV